MTTAVRTSSCLGLDVGILKSLRLLVSCLVIVNTKLTLHNL